MGRFLLWANKIVNPLPYLLRVTPLPLIAVRYLRHVNQRVKVTNFPSYKQHWSVARGSQIKDVPIEALQFILTQLHVGNHAKMNLIIINISFTVLDGGFAWTLRARSDAIHVSDYSNQNELYTSIWMVHYDRKFKPITSLVVRYGLCHGREINGKYLGYP